MATNGRFLICWTIICLFPIAICSTSTTPNKAAASGTADDLKKEWSRRSFKIACENIKGNLAKVQMVFLQHLCKIPRDAYREPLRGICEQKKMPDRFQLCEKYMQQKYHAKDPTGGNDPYIAVSECKSYEVYVTDYKQRPDTAKDFPEFQDYFGFHCMMYSSPVDSAGLVMADFTIMSEGLQEGTAFIHKKLEDADCETAMKVVEHVVVDNKKSCTTVSLSAGSKGNNVAKL